MIEVSLLSIQLTKENNIILYISIGKEKEIKKKKDGFIALMTCYYSY